MTTTMRMVHSTMEEMPTARLMNEKFRASREAISAETMSPRATADRTCSETHRYRQGSVSIGNPGSPFKGQSVFLSFISDGNIFADTLKGMVTNV